MDEINERKPAKHRIRDSQRGSENIADESGDRLRSAAFSEEKEAVTSQKESGAAGISSLIFSTTELSKQSTELQKATLDYRHFEPARTSSSNFVPDLPKGTANLEQVKPAANATEPFKPKANDSPSAEALKPAPSMMDPPKPVASNIVEPPKPAPTADPPKPDASQVIDPPKPDDSTNGGGRPAYLQNKTSVLEALKSDNIPNVGICETPPKSPPAQNSPESPKPVSEPKPENTPQAPKPFIESKPENAYETPKPIVEPKPENAAGAPKPSLTEARTEAARTSSGVSDPSGGFKSAETFRPNESFSKSSELQSSKRAESTTSSSFEQVESRQTSNNDSRSFALDSGRTGSFADTKSASSEFNKTHSGAAETRSLDFSEHKLPNTDTAKDTGITRSSHEFASNKSGAAEYSRDNSDRTRSLFQQEQAHNQEIRWQASDSVASRNRSTELQSIQNAAASVAASAPAIEKSFFYMNARLSEGSSALARSSNLSDDSSLQSLKFSSAGCLAARVDGIDRIQGSQTDRCGGLMANNDKITGIIPERTLSMTLSTDKSLSLSQITEKSSSVPGMSDRSSILSGTERGTVIDRSLQTNGPSSGPSVQDRGLAANDLTGRTILRPEDGIMAHSGRKDGMLTGIPGQADRLIANTDIHTGNKSIAFQDGSRGLETHKTDLNGKITIDKSSEALTADASGKSLNGSKFITTNGPIDPGALVVRGAIDPSAFGSKGDFLLMDGEAVLEDGNLISKRIKFDDKRYLTGVEVTIAAILTMSGAAKLRPDRSLNPEANAAEQDNNCAPQTQKILQRRTHLVSHGDTLQSIAEELYQNPAVGWLIADMNGTNTKEEWIDGKRVVELKSRQQLELPEPEEVTAFMSRLRRDFNVDQLVTVVSESTVDRELLNNFLGTVSGAQQTTEAPVQAIIQVPLQASLPELTIEIADPEDLPVSAGIANIFKDLSSKVSHLVKRPARKLGTV